MRTGAALLVFLCLVGACATTTRYRTGVRSHLTMPLAEHCMAAASRQVDWVDTVSEVDDERLAPRVEQAAQSQAHWLVARGQGDAQCWVLQRSDPRDGVLLEGHVTWTNRRPSSSEVTAGAARCRDVIQEIEAVCSARVTGGSTTVECQDDGASAWRPCPTATP
jgi:adenosyl cobinamide kinase/adenosyl cobinamide phosphate guanylyltransferase